jgi:hypothetical protein
VLPNESRIVEPGDKVRWWEKPEKLPSGPCQLTASGLPGLAPQWGHVATAIQPYGQRIIGRAFFSCTDTEYYMRGWPLDTAILLDAQHPGRIPAPIPLMTPVRGMPGLFNASAGWHGQLTARRDGASWLVVAGGSGLAQRIEVLSHLRARIALPRRAATG